jgi:hypothetical protein
MRVSVIGYGRERPLFEGLPSVDPTWPPTKQEWEEWKENILNAPLREDHLLLTLQQYRDFFGEDPPPIEELDPKDDSFRPPPSACRHWNRVILG